MGNNGHEPQTSPRKKQLQVLHDAGCTNKVIAHYIIDLARKGLAGSVIDERIQGITTATANDVTTWISAVESFV